MAGALGFLGAVGAALSMVYVSRSTGNSNAWEGAFKVDIQDVVREYGGHVSIHNWVDERMWSLIFVSWCLVMIYQFLSYVRSSRHGLVSSYGLIPWSFNLFAIVGMFAHVNWMKLILARDLFGALIVVFLAVHIFMGALMVVLDALYKKTPNLQKAGLNLDVYVVRVLVINATDFFCTYSFFNLFTILDAYLVSVCELTPDNSNFYVMATLAFFQIINVYFDLYYCNYLLRYLAGGYITMITGSFGIMLYQMVTLPHLPMITLLNFVLAFLCPMIKINVQSNQIEQIKEPKQKKS